MDTAAFWAIIERSRQASAGDVEAHVELLTEALAALPAQSIAEFEALFIAQLNRAFLPALLDAAYLMNGGCSEDGFLYFRAWLIGQGESIFEKALVDPESLAEAAGDEDSDEHEAELLMYAALEAYERLTGLELPQTQSPAQFFDTHWSYELRPEEYEAQLVRRSPRLAERFL